MRIVYIGCVDFSYHCLKELLVQRQNVVAVFSKDRSKFHSDFKSLKPLAQKYKISYCSVLDINANKWIKAMKRFLPDVIFCLGWSQMLGKEILKIAPLGVIGAHPSFLPCNRGRHPLVWSLFLGLSQSALTFFRMNETPDAGEIISQKIFRIFPRDDAASLYNKIKELASQQLREFLPLLNNGKLRVIKQNSKKTNYWRKRTPQDGLIDWRMSSEAIYNLVKALRHPYVGAHCLYNGKQIRIWKVKPVSYKRRNVEPGKVLNSKGRRLVVKTYDGAIEIIEHGFLKTPNTGEYL